MEKRFGSKDSQGGTELSIYEYLPKLFRNTKFVQKQSNIGKTHVKTQAFQTSINKDDEKLVLTASNPRNEMRISLPIAVEELPRDHTKATEKTPIRVVLHDPVDLRARDDEEKGDLVALLYIELIGQDKKIGLGTAKKWRGVYEDSSSDDSMYTPTRTRNRVTINSTPTLVTRNVGKRTPKHVRSSSGDEDAASISTNTSIASWMARSLRNLFGSPPPDSIVLEDQNDDAIDHLLGE